MNRLILFFSAVAKREYPEFDNTAPVNRDPDAGLPNSAFGNRLMSQGKESAL